MTCTRWRLSDLPEPWLRLVEPALPVRGVIGLLHGGAERGADPPGALGLAALRMRTFEWSLAKQARRRGLVVGTIRYRHRGWAAGGHAEDVRHALDAAQRRYGTVPSVLIGHSLGGRAALLASDHSSVVGVVALAPWLPPSEPVSQLSGRDVVIIHGVGDRMTDPAGSLRYALRAASFAQRLARFEVVRGEHTLIHRSGVYHRLTGDYTLAALGAAPASAELERAFTLDLEQRVRIRV